MAPSYNHRVSEPSQTGRSPRARSRARGVVYALLSAVLFGGSTPIVRPALDRADPVASAGYLYLGQTIVLGIWWLVARAAGSRREAALGRADLGPLLAGTIAGGLIAPVAFTSGLALIPAHRASLLLGLEIVFTLLIAIGFRGERLSPRGWMGAAMLLAAGVLISWPSASAGPVGPAASTVASTAVSAAFVPVGLSTAGVLLIVVACLGWATDSNITAGIAGKDPTAIALVKGIAASVAYLGGCAIFGRRLTAPPGDLVALLAAGAIGYGLSLRLFIVALRHLGAALTTTVFSTAPIAGFALSVLLLGESPAIAGWAAFVLAGAGVAIVSGWRHDDVPVPGTPEDGDARARHTMDPETGSLS